MQILTVHCGLIDGAVSVQSVWNNHVTDLVLRCTDLSDRAGDDQYDLFCVCVRMV